MTIGNSNLPLANPLPKVLQYLGEGAQFIDPKLISSVQEIVFHITKKKPTEKAVMVILEGLDEAGYVKIYSLQDNVKTIRKIKNGN